MKLMPAIIVALVAAILLWFAYSAQAQATNEFSCTTDKGHVIYRGPTNLSALGFCNLYVSRENGSATVTNRYTENGVEKRIDIAMISRAGQGIWTWVAPTQLENGNILTDLSHYLLYRQVIPEAPVLWAQIDGKTQRFVAAMKPEDFGACFYFVAVRKPATSPAVASDKSNTICMDAKGQLLPAT